ncbi:uncharacterized protein LOC111704369, partial [Eurytemora carolleeae]|uniref:uncharacterized protein LOC111704369 n=1 Tax=Eurytemora carolleeae TaxID=1294199 RepID=UPI000C761B59
MGFLVKSNIPRKAQGRGNLFGQQYYQPLHKTFLEFVAGFYLLCLVRDQDIDKLEEELELLSGMEYTSMEQLLLYSVEMLGNQAHFILGRLGCITHLKETTILGLLSAAGFTDENVKALTSFLNLENITVNCSLRELDSWTYICTQSSIIQSLKVHWEPKMLSFSDPKVSKFFQELEKKNKSIQCVELSIFHGTMKEHANVLFKDQKDHFIKELASFTNLLRSMMCKKNLKYLKVDLQVIQPDTCLQVDYSQPIINTVAEVFKIKGSDLTLTSLILNVDLDTNLISTLLAGLEFYPFNCL